MNTKATANRADIAKVIAANTTLKKGAAEKLIELIESEIIDGLKRKAQVKIKGFGTYYLLRRRSRTIKTIHTKSTRLLLERNELKFRASKSFKNELLGIPNRPKRMSRSAYTRAATATQDKAARGTQIPVEASTTSVPKSPFKFKLPVQPRVDKDQIKKKILERLMKLAGQKEFVKSGLEIDLPTAVNLSKTVEDKIFAALLRQAIKQNYNNIHFTLRENPKLEVFAGRPRQKITVLPAAAARKFLEERLEITHFDRPQERQMRLVIPASPKLAFNLSVYMLPNLDGASVYFKISQVKVYNNS